MGASKALLCLCLTSFGLLAQAQVDNVQLQIVRLQDADPVVRTIAVIALGQFKDARAIDPLLASLKDPDSLVRMIAASSLSGFKEPREVPPLIAALSDPNGDVSMAAGFTLGDLQDPRAIPAMISALADHRGGGMSLTRMGHAAVPALIEALHDSNPKVRGGVAEALATLKDSAAVTPLLAAIHDPDAAVRRSVVVALSSFHDSRTADTVMAETKDPDATVREVVVRLLDRMDDPRAFAALLAATHDPVRAVQLSAWGALGQSGDPRAVAPLIDALKSDDAGIRANAIGWLMRFHQPEVVPVLMAEYRSIPDRSTRLRALEGLGIPGDRAVTDFLIAALADGDSGVRMTAAKSLGKTQDVRAVKALSAGLVSPSNNDKQPFYQALAHMGPAAYEWLLEQVHDSRSCPQAVGYLAATHDPRAVTELVALLHTPYSGPDAPGLVGMATRLDMERAAARAHEVTGTCFFAAAKVLAALHDERVIAPLMESLKTPHSGRGQVPDLLRVFGPAVVEPMIALFHDADQETRRLAALTLAFVPEARLDAALKKKRDTALRTALRELNLAVLAGDYRYYVVLGELGSEDSLARALKRFDNTMEAQEMAETFLTCGDVLLEDAGFAWGRERHFHMTPSSYGVVWGRGVEQARGDTQK
ncbi:HEAT repeat domain-containing protein [Granulicella tundricola]|uniref:PBS lyase HEAT domain protein repeat-containing protein n=1 Tax=Granulicella tundricola (strain ATCC BAA-1859 / DSM 23138 / MP5ACTX9) TaxID=1198114 RepID=E8X804_GRATM|nr:HEAT repeat domain-containing protein [Granulicella tundricola]ADW71588.1 PBS lyase HEAT domain protein repeat-containing protein [Granulicella tundricola MP5ACTX9]